MSSAPRDGVFDRPHAQPAYAFPAQGASLDSQRPIRPDSAEHSPEANLGPREVDVPVELPATRREKRHPLDSLEVSGTSSSVIDRDESSPPAPGSEPRPVNAASRFGWEAMDNEAAGEDFLKQASEEDGPPATPIFSDSLITNGEYGERD